MKQALLVIDAQQELIEGTKKTESVYNKETLIKNINMVIDKAIQSEVLIIFVRDIDVAAGIGKGFEVHENINVPSSAELINKAATNSFYGTSLLSLLQEQEISHLVIMGCATEYCIDTAVRTATINHFDVTLVGDGHSTTNSKTLTAEQIITHHNAVLHGHYNVDNFSIVRNAGEDLFSPTHDSYR